MNMACWPDEERAMKETRLPKLALLSPIEILARSAYKVPKSVHLPQAALTTLTKELSRLYTVLPQDRVDTALHSLGMGQSRPFSLHAAERRRDFAAIARRLDAYYIARAAVTGCHIRAISGTGMKRVELTLAIYLSNFSGELENGAIYMGMAHTGIPERDTAAWQRALSGAATNAVKTIEEYSVPRAVVSVVLPGGTRVLLRVSDTLPFETGRLREGMQMLIAHNRTEIARVRVCGEQGKEAIADVFQGKGIRPGDKAIAVFRLGCYTTE
jgi:hypothetical protein